MAVELAVPLLAPQRADVLVAVTDNVAEGAVMTAVAVLVQLLASVTVTV